MSSCDWGFTFEAMKVYHDTEWGVPVHDDRVMFEHLMMEAMTKLMIYHGEHGWTFQS